MSVRPVQADLVSYQGRYAGSVSRFTAYVIDLLLTIGVFYVALAAISFGWQIVTGNSVHWNRSNTGVVILFVAWHLFYMGYSWASSGRTFGMAVLGICVVRADGTTVDSRHGFLRALAFPLSFLTLGLGFLGILVQREHRALQDLIAGTAVVYAWDARAARLRFLARQAELGAPGVPQPAVSSSAVPSSAVPSSAVPSSAVPSSAVSSSAVSSASVPPPGVPQPAVSPPGPAPTGSGPEGT